jgi:uncharacterized protein
MTNNDRQAAVAPWICHLDSRTPGEVRSTGGLVAHDHDTAHRFKGEEAKAAGRKGGLAAHMNETTHQFSAAETIAAGKNSGKSKEGTS